MSTACGPASRTCTTSPTALPTAAVMGTAWSVLLNTEPCRGVQPFSWRMNARGLLARPGVRLKSDKTSSGVAAHVLLCCWFGCCGDKWHLGQSAVL
jgi:hypothetical protein